MLHLSLIGTVFTVLIKNVKRLLAYWNLKIVPIIVTHEIF
jgi:hypothetical protein